MMRDKIVFSMTGKLQELVLREDDLNLSKAVKVCRAFEQSNKHVKEIRDTKKQHVHKVSPNKPENRSKQKKKFQCSTDHVHHQNSVSHRGKSTKKPRVTPNKQKSCIFCGYNHEMQKENCPAWGKVCNACKGRNHLKQHVRKYTHLKEKTVILTMITG